MKVGLYKKDRTSQEQLIVKILPPLRLALAILAVASTFCAQPAVAQKRVVQYRPYIDQRKLHYGFLAGIHMQDIEFQNNGYIDAAGNEWYADQANYEPGFSVGVLAELRLTEHLAFRVIPSMHFGSKVISFQNHLDGATDRQEIKSTYISVPLDLKIAGERFNNYRPYAVVGLNPMYDLTVKRNRNLLVKSFNCYAEIGFGCDFYTPFFKFIPEIKFAWGLSDVLEKNRSDLTNTDQLIFTNSIDKARSKMIILTFYFE